MINTELLKVICETPGAPGFEQAIRSQYPLKRAVNMIKGNLVIPEVAETFQLPLKTLGAQ